jgi:hypothetical protein
MDDSIEAVAGTSDFDLLSAFKFLSTPPLKAYFSRATANEVDRLRRLAWCV